MADARDVDERILIGASWYPEMWPEEQWAMDVAKMREVGFNATRLFEFAWARMEPSEGVYDFDWAKRILDMCHAAGIQVMVGTPTAAPPAWLTAQYPEVLQTKEDGKVAEHGKRRHVNQFSIKYRELCAAIVRQMVNAFAQHPAVHSWQIDNEINGRDFSQNTCSRFHEWLSDRYGSIEKLNETWGLNFWSQKYDRFDQIPLPTASLGGREVQERHHPSLMVAAQRFQTEGWVEFIDVQTSIIREHSQKPITTNMCGSGLNLDWERLNQGVDRVGYSVYADVEHYSWTLERYDRMRVEKFRRPYWLLETAPNWSGGGRQWNIHHNSSGVKAASWISTALGGSMTLFWQWREHWAGQEMLHGTCVTATGKWRPNKGAWMDLSSAYDKCGSWLLSNPPLQADIALMRTTGAAWSFSIDPVDENMEYVGNWRDRFYLPLVQSHIWRDVIGENADFSNYKVIIAPMIPMMKDETRRRLEQWVRDGGVLILGPMTGHRTPEFTVYKEQELGGFEGMAGVEVIFGFTAQWREEHIKIRLANQSESGTRAWCDAFQLAGAEAIGWYECPGEYGHQQIAITANDYGAGAVVLVGCMLDSTAYLSLVTRAMQMAGLTVSAKGSSDVLVVPRANANGDITGYVVVNLVQKVQRVTLPFGGVDMITDEPCGPVLNLEPMGVRVVRLA